jgi:hypothetical protein
LALAVVSVVALVALTFAQRISGRGTGQHRSAGGSVVGLPRRLNPAPRCEHPVTR